MRVAVYLHPDHPEAGADEQGNRASEPVCVAYNLGRIEEGVHNAPIGHAAVPYDEFVEELLSAAKADYPDALDVRLEKLIDNGDNTASWIAADEFDPERHVAQGAGNVKAAEFHVTNEQDGS